MVVQLSLVFTLTVHLGHLLEGGEHRLNDLIVRGIDNFDGSTITTKQHLTQPELRPKQ